MNYALAIACLLIGFASGVSAGLWLARKKRKKDQALTPLLGVVLPPEKGN